MNLNACMFMLMTRVYGKSTYYDSLMEVVSWKAREEGHCKDTRTLNLYSSCNKALVNVGSLEGLLTQRRGCLGLDGD